MNEIARKAIEVHSIKTECAISHGSDVNLVFDELTVILNVIPRDGFVIAYRMFHEDQIFMCNLTQEQATNWISAPKCVRIPGICGNICQRWRQGDVHKTEEKEDFWRKAYQVAQRHNCTTPKSFILTSHIGMAFADVEMTWDIFKYNIQEKDKK